VVKINGAKLMMRIRRNLPKKQARKKEGKMENKEVVILIIISAGVFFVIGLAVGNWNIDETRETYFREGWERSAKNSDEIGYAQGVNKGIEICESSLKPMIRQFTPPKDCVIVVLDDIMMKYICEGDELFAELTQKTGDSK
jgi:hypothetical protein